MNYRVAVIGGGGIAEKHLEVISAMKMLQPAAVADLNEDRARSLSSAYGIRPYTDYKEMIRSEKPDIAVVTLPHYLHREAAVFCADQGCHLLLEKPMALNAQECDDIISAAQQSGIRVLVGHTQHYIAENRKAKQLIAEGSLGQLVMVNDIRHVYYYKEQRPGWFLEKAKAGGGILTNLGSHSVDKIQWLSGRRIAKVRAVLSYYGEKGDVEGGGLVFMQTADGLPATISQSGYKGAHQDVTELIFTKGMLRLKTGRSLEISDGGDYREVPVERGAEPFKLEYEDLLTAIETGSEPSCTLEYSRSIVAATDAVYRSHEEQREIDVT